MSDTRKQFETFIAEYASAGTFDLAVCPEFPEQYDSIETQMLYDSFTAGAQLAAHAPDDDWNSPKHRYGSVQEDPEHYKQARMQGKPPTNMAQAMSDIGRQAVEYVAAPALSKQGTPATGENLAKAMQEEVMRRRIAPSERQPCPECRCNYPLHDLDCKTGRARGERKPVPYDVALTAIERLRGCAATTIEDHEKDCYTLNDQTMPQAVAFMWAKEIHRIDAKVFLDEAIQDAKENRA